MKMNKKNYSQAYLEECKYEIKKKKMIKFIYPKLNLDDSDNFDLAAYSGTFYTCEPQTRDPDESGLTLEEHSWCFDLISKQAILCMQSSFIS